MRQTIDEVTRVHTLAVLDGCHGHQTNAAKVLGIDRKTLARNLVRWGIVVPPERRELEPGSLIVIEGLDGAGITTQAKRLVDALKARGHDALLTAEPSDGPIGQLVRRLLAGKPALAPAGAFRALSLLFAADRVDHFHAVVAPALANHTTVVSDRWYHSSLAYQRTGVERDWIETLNLHTRVPDVTVFLEVRPEVAQQRRTRAGRAQELFHDPATQREVAAGYRTTIAELRAKGERIDVIDGEQLEDIVFGTVLGVVGVDRRESKGARSRPPDARRRHDD